VRSGVDCIAFSVPRGLEFSMDLDGIAVFGILMAALCLLLGISRHLDTSIRRQREAEKLER
jgi:hypothetical protein